MAINLKSTWERGTETIARVTSYENSNRADVNYGFVSLHVLLEDGRTLKRDRVSLPHSLLPRLEGKSRLTVRVRPGAAQDIVIDDLMPAHWLIAASQFGISLLGALLLFIGVFWWNRTLWRQEDLIS